MRPKARRIIEVQPGGLHLEHKEFRIESEWTKVRRPRVIRLTSTAVAWLKLLPQRKPDETMMPVPSRNVWVNRWKNWRKAPDAPLPWVWWKGKADVLRKTAATMMQAMPPRNVNFTAEQLGTSAQQIRRFYNGVVPQRVAEKYWDILPK